MPPLNVEQSAAVTVQDRSPICVCVSDPYVLQVDVLLHFVYYPFSHQVQKEKTQKQMWAN
jgi:hypothetical protein